MAARNVLNVHNVNQISGSTEVVANANTTIFHHPGYHGGEAVNDQVMADIVGVDEPVPAQVFAVVHHINVIGAQNLDLVVKLAMAILCCLPNGN